MKHYEVPSIELIAFEAKETVANDDNYGENIEYGALVSTNSNVG